MQDIQPIKIFSTYRKGSVKEQVNEENGEKT